MNGNEHIAQGYKSTSIGMIPATWEVRRLGDFSTFYSGGTPKSDNALYYNGHIPFIRSGEINRDKTELFLSQEGLNNSSAKIVEEGDILYALYGANSGQCSLSKINGAINQAILCIRPKADKYYIMSVLQFNKEHYYNSYLQGGQGNLSCEIVSNYKIAVPPIEEQKKIAEILSEWNKAIELQTKLIGKLEMRKRALMQRLLTGRVRLNGYSVEWENVRLEQIISLAKGEQYNKVLLQKDDKYPVINGGIIPSGYTDKYNSEANTITISEGGNSCGYVNLMTTRFWCGGHCYAVKEKDMVHKLFLYQLLKYHEPIIMRLRVGSGLPNIQMKTLQKYRLRIPPFPEQANIASILITTDREIDLEKQRLSSLRTQKQGLMQQLLTGTKRVKTNI